MLFSRRGLPCGAQPWTRILIFLPSTHDLKDRSLEKPCSTSTNSSGHFQEETARGPSCPAGPGAGDDARMPSSQCVPKFWGPEAAGAPASGSPIRLPSPESVAKDGRWLLGAPLALLWCDLCQGQGWGVFPWPTLVLAWC